MKPAAPEVGDVFREFNAVEPMLETMAGPQGNAGCTADGGVAFGRGILEHGTRRRADDPAKTRKQSQRANE